MSLSQKITSNLTSSFIENAERGLIPDALLRAGIRKLCRDRLESLTGPTLEKEEDRLQEYVKGLKRLPIAVHTQAANEQHYELPPEFFEKVLGRNRKYSSCYFGPGISTTPDGLDQAEDEALKETMRRAEIRDGMRILELGCGWGSLTLAMARKFPNSKITALSNSAPQRENILSRAAREGLTNVEILTLNMADEFDLGKDTFDRCVSVEMFEHMKNYELLLARISRWLKPDGKLFVHIFTHKKFAYPFETEGEDNWMGRYFFTGGQMPSHDLLLHFQKDLTLESRWFWDGTHYGKTSECWLLNQDQRKDEILPILEKTYGRDNALIWFNRWRIFFMACAELFSFKNGSEWGVSHYLFKKGDS